MYLRNILNFIICLSRNPNLSRTHDIEASFTPFNKSNPNLSHGNNSGMVIHSELYVGEMNKEKLYG